MTPVYDAENIIDAHLVVHLLADAGLSAHVFGASLAGAMGELPAAGLIRVWIEEDGRASDAIALIADWQAAPAPDAGELDRLAQGGDGFVLA